MKIEIGPAVWTVNTVMNMEDFGRTDVRWSIIALSSDQHVDQMRDSLLHEVLHAIVFTYGIQMGSEENQEAIVKTLTPALLDVLRSNPELVDQLLG